jgi:hypothetical protein
MELFTVKIERLESKGQKVGLFVNSGIKEA